MNDERQWIDGYLDEELTRDDERRLAEWLAADREHVRQFVRDAQLHRQIRDAMLARHVQTDALAPLKEPNENPRHRWFVHSPIGWRNCLHYLGPRRDAVPG